MPGGSMAKNQAKTLFSEEKILLVCHAIFEVLPSARQNPALNQSPQRVRVQLGLLEDSFQMVNPKTLEQRTRSVNSLTMTGKEGRLRPISRIIDL